MSEDLERAEREQVAGDVVDYQDEHDPEARDGWHISDLAGADWALSRIADLQQEISENEALEEAALLRLKSRAALLNERARRGIEFFTSRLREYAETHRDELLKGGKKKSRALMNGSIGWAKKGGGLAVLDADELLGWASTQPAEKGFVRVKSAPALDAIKEHVKATGEIPPGTDLKPEFEEFIAKPTEPAKGKLQ